MMPIKQLDIVAIGDEDLVSGMRLAGLNRYYLIKGEHDIGEEVRKALGKLLGHQIPPLPTSAGAIPDDFPE